MTNEKATTADLGNRDIGQGGIWSRNLILLAVAIFLLGVGTGLQNSIGTNLMKQLGPTGSQVLLRRRTSPLGSSSRP